MTASTPAAISRRRFVTLAGGAIGLALAVGAARKGYGQGGASTPVASPMAGENLSTGAVFLTIRNDGAEADRLLGGTTDMALGVEVHEMRTENGVGTMRFLENGLEIPAGETVSLESGGTHLMLIGLTESLYPEATYELTLVFERAGEVTLTVPVRRNAPEGDEAGEPVTAADLTIEGAWSRPAPKLDGMATPAATPGR